MLLVTVSLVASPVCEVCSLNIVYITYKNDNARCDILIQIESVELGHMRSNMKKLRIGSKEVKYEKDANWVK